MNDEGFREIQLNGKQLIFLFMAVTVVLVVTFLFGVLVGRGVREGGGAPEIASGDIASDPRPRRRRQTPAGPPPAAGSAPPQRRRAARGGAQLCRASAARYACRRER